MAPVQLDSISKLTLFQNNSIPLLNNHNKINPLLLIFPAGIFLVLFYLVPLIQVILLSFQEQTWSLSQYARIIQDPVQLEVLGNTLTLSLGVAALSLLGGYPVAYFLVTCRERVRRIIILLIIASVWISILVRTYAWMVILGRKGPVNTLLQALGIITDPLPLLYNSFSVYAGMLHIMLPFMILPLYGVMRQIDLRLVDNARSLGAGPFTAFWFIFFPLSLPGILAGSLLVFIISIGFFITPALLGGIDNTTFVMLIEKEVSRFLNWELAAAMSVVLLFATLALVYIYQYLLSAKDQTGRSSRTPLIAGLNRLLEGLIRIKFLLANKIFKVFPSFLADWFGHLGGFAGLFLSRLFPWLVIAFLLAPLLIIFPLSFSEAQFLQFPPKSYSMRWYQEVFSRADWVNPILTSTRIALTVVVIATLLGTMAAIPIARREFAFKPAFVGFLLSPMIVPVIVLAVSMHFYTSRLGLSGTLQALIIGHIVLALPFVIVVMSNALKSVDENLERVARTLGATPWIAFSRITLVLVRPAILTAALFAFLASFDELVIALFLSGPMTQTLPIRLWDAVREEIDPTTAAVAVIITVVSLCAILIAEYARSKIGEKAKSDAGA